MDPKDAQVLMVRRKDSMSYTEFIRGKYSNEDPAYLHTLVENMTQSEQMSIRTHPFDALWVKLWGNGVEHHINEYPYAKERYESQDRTQLLDQYPSRYPEPEWGFPKGRRIRCETDQDCAIREFTEETNIPREAYTIFRDIQLTEVFRGTNGIMYKHIYFLALVKDPSKIQLDQKFTAMQRREISAIGWKSLDECQTLTRPHYSGREPMLQNLRQILTTFEEWSHEEFR